MITGLLLTLGCGTPTPPPATPVDTDPPTDTDVEPVGPVVDAAGWRFAFDSVDLFAGIELWIDATAGDEPIHSVQIIDGATVRWEDLTRGPDGRTRVPIPLDLGSCTPIPNSADISFRLVDAGGRASDVEVVHVEWTAIQHEECADTTDEPCVAGLTLQDLPVVVCGSKRTEALPDAYDAIAFPVDAGSAPFRVTANLQSVFEEVRFGVTPQNGHSFFDVHTIHSSAEGAAIQVDSPTNPLLLQFTIDGPSLFSEADWTMWFQAD